MAVPTPDGSPGGPIIAAALTALNAGEPKRWKTVASTAITASAFVSLARAHYNRWKANQTYSVTITQDDEIWYMLQRWLLDTIPSPERRALNVETICRHQRSPDGHRRLERVLGFGFGEERQQIVHFEGHAVQVFYHPSERPHRGRRTGGDEPLVDGSRMLMLGDPAKIIFVADDADGRDAVLRFLEEILAAMDTVDTGPTLNIGNSWGDWRRVMGMKARSIDTVVLRKGVKEDLIDDLQRFLDAEDRYIDMGIPWHRGYLLHGPPGTGKTSVVKAIAQHLGLALYYLPLSDLEQDSNLSQMMMNVPDRSIVLLEDIDVVRAAKDRDDQHVGISLSGLLNALDGVATPHGLITVMTTNDIDALDPALIRAGRADRTVYIDVMDDDQVRELVKTLLPDLSIRDLPPLGDKVLTPAELVEIVKENLDDSERAYREIVNLLGGAVTATGKVLSSEDFMALAREAEQGYDVSHLPNQRTRTRRSVHGD